MDADGLHSGLWEGDWLALAQANAALTPEEREALAGKK